MDALQFDARSKQLKYGKIPIPKVTEPGDVLIRVHYAGICGTDLHILEGKFPCREDGPLTLGHELSGEVIEVGKGVKHLKAGDKVGVDPNQGCHSCKVCREGNPHFCLDGSLDYTIGIYKDGGWAEYVLAPKEQVHKIPPKVETETAVFCEPLSCIVHGYDLTGSLKIGQDILIVGAGIIGNLWATVLHHQGHRRVTVSEPNTDRLNNLRNLDLGFELVTPDQLEKSRGYDVVVDCSGFVPAIEQALKLLRKGGKMVLFGVSPPEAKLTITPYDFFKNELTLMGVKVNPHTYEDSLGLAEAMGKRYLNYSGLGVEAYDLKDYQKAFKELKGGGISKAVFKFAVK